MFLAYIAIEIYLVMHVVEASGLLAFIVEIAISALVGFGILASQFNVMSEYLGNIATFKLSVSSFLGRSILRLLGGILLILPFVLSDILGVILFIMSLFFRAESKQNFDAFGDFRNTNNFNNSHNYNDSDIIDAEIIERVEKK